MYQKLPVFSLTLLSVAPLQSSSISVTCWASLSTGTPRSEGPRPSSVRPSYKLHSPKHATTYTAGWPACRVQQVCVCVCVWEADIFLFLYIYFAIVLYFAIVRVRKVMETWKILEFLKWLFPGLEKGIENK